MVKAVIFDLDGTIVEFNIAYKELRTEIRNLLTYRGVPVSLLSINDSIFEMLNKTEIFMKNNGASKQQIADVKNEALKIAEKYEWEAAKTLGLKPGALETLKALRNMGLKIGLCTINGEKTVNYILTKFRIGSFFDAVVTRDHVTNIKPHSEHLNAVLEALEAKPEEAVMIGDSVLDVKSARELKVIAVGLPTGPFTEEDLIKAGANYIITSITDVPVLVKHLRNSIEQK
ncbi:HAD family hydrolase [Candidatus Bathyarchaeota archaeon]|nr:HAD family hydrolase [Candidatus Bathyarchaeota archaeon]